MKITSLMMVLFLTLTAFSDDRSPSKSSPADLITELGSSKFDIRQSAHNSLVGTPQLELIPLLTTAVRDPNVERSRRCLIILGDIALKGRGPVRKEASRVIDELKQSELGPQLKAELATIHQKLNDRTAELSNRSGIECNEFGDVVHLEINCSRKRSINATLPQHIHRSTITKVHINDLATDADCTAISTFDGVESLALSKAEIPVDRYQFFTRLKSLRRLTLSGCSSLSSDGLHHLRECPLETLIVIDCPITDMPSDFALHHQGIVSLAFIRTSLSTAAIKQLSTLPQLKSLHLRGTSVTEKGLECLLDCRGLERIDLTECSLSRDSVEKFRSRHPNPTLKIGPF